MLIRPHSPHEYSRNILMNDHHEKRSGSGQHEKKYRKWSTRNKNRKWSTRKKYRKWSPRKKSRKWSPRKKIRKWSPRKRNRKWAPRKKIRKWSPRKRNRKWPVTFDSWPLTLGLWPLTSPTKKAPLTTLIPLTLSPHAPLLILCTRLFLYDFRYFLISTYLMVYFVNLGPFNDAMGAPWWHNDELGPLDNVMGN